MIRTKMLVTLGPSIHDYNLVKSVIREGVSGFRINFSHGEPRVWEELIKIVKDAAEELDRVVLTIGDIPGPQVRSGDYPEQEIRFKSKVVLIPGDKAEEPGVIPIPVKKFFETVDIGDLILLDDGRLMLRVVEVNSEGVEALALNDARILPRRKVVISGKEVNLPLLSESDVKYIQFSVMHGLTYIAVSYIRGPEDVDIVKDIISKHGGKQRVIAKIETRSGVERLSEIVEVADAILVARGDLGLHFTLEKIPLLQKKIIREAIRSGKPCILATQLLESMVNSPRPSRSEVIDVMSAVNDYIDALLLTNETAIGKYPLESVKWLKKIIEVAEENSDERVLEDLRGELSYKTLKEKYALGLTLLAEKIHSKVLVYTKTGSIPRKISRVRPQIPVYVGTANKFLAESLALHYGINPYYLNHKKTLDYNEGVRLLYSYLRSTGELGYGDIVAEAYGRRETEIHEIKIRQVL